jgi:hypothetical protein
MPPPGRLLAAIALVALIGTGCSNAPAESGSGSGGGDNENAAGNENAATEASPNPERKGRLAEFAKCMRENGVEDFPDPDDNGVVQYYGAGDQPEYKSAQENCRHLAPELGTENGGPGGGG